jgi:EAL domain-containing protein (putative c-di-GMP-specific phosphodiesterase class I)
MRTAGVGGSLSVGLVGPTYGLNLSVVAEGIETAATLDTLRVSQCDEGQGYLFSRPLSLAEFQLFLARLPAPACAV